MGFPETTTADLPTLLIVDSMGASLASIRSAVECVRLLVASGSGWLARLARPSATFSTEDVSNDKGK